jgi:transcriptional regulator with XRE-family HTH domain
MMKKPFDMRARRKELGLTLEELGAKAGLSGSVVRQLEVGAFKGTFLTRHKIADALGIPVRFLMSEEEQAAMFAVMSEGVRDKKGQIQMFVGEEPKQKD